MIEKIIKEINFDKLSEFYENIKYLITDERQDKQSIIYTLSNGCSLRFGTLLFGTNNKNKWLSFSLSYDNKNFYSIDFQFCNDLPKSEGNIYIREDYYDINGDVVNTFNSCYVYSDNEYKSGWQQIRKVYLNDIKDYLGVGDGLHNLTCVIDSYDIEKIVRLDLNHIQEEPLFYNLENFHQEEIAKIKKKRWDIYKGII